MGVSYWIVIFFASTLAFAYGQQSNTRDDCRVQETCRDCIRTPNCVWCSIVIDEREVEQPPARCVNQKHAQDNQWCSPEFKVNPRTRARVTKNVSLSSEKSSQHVQIQPQVVKLQLRRGEEYRLKVRYRQAEDYPVDLYFLVDLSSSMNKFKNALAELTGQIKEAMQKLTTNFRLGFGSFVDKKLRPMIVDGPRWDWRKHYSFFHQLSLTNLSEIFENTVKNSDVIRTSDAPEGGLDGMMQAIVCTDQIGWRSDARHLLVHASDASLHIAGDGRLAGVIEPNDEQCHLEKGTGLYTKAELQDYPSLGQINNQARKNNINIIFATVDIHKESYIAIQSLIQDSAVGTFDGNSASVVQLISNQYEKLVRSLRMSSNSTSKFLDVKFFSRCLDKHGELQRTDKCDGIRVKATVEFEVVIKAIDCPVREEDWHQTIEIKPEGINEGVIVNVDLICGCDQCSKKSDKEKDAPRVEMCNNHGVLDCGICSCDQGHFGKWCQCEGGQNVANADALLENCRMDNTSNICSGRGNCICGSCDCNEIGNTGQKYYKQFCQCDHISCKRSNGKLCGGHGTCDCGNCMCDPGWDGDTCECQDETSLCIPPGDNTKICSGFGRCVCGQCKCNDPKTRRGRFCEDCLTCPGQRCDEFEDCVECVVHKSGRYYVEDSLCLRCSKINITKVDAMDEDSKNQKSDEHICRIAGDDGSTFVFKYVYPNGEDKDPIIVAVKNKKYRVIDDFLAATLGVVLLTLLLGFLILLIWKVLTSLHDKREFQKFTKESSNTHFGQGQNPLYIEAVATFQNPTFEAEPAGEQVLWSRK